MTLEERIANDYTPNRGGWKLSEELFGDVGVDIHDFGLDNYTYFLDNVATLEELVRGLHELSPLTDDVLVLAERMTKRDFYRFKKALPCERVASEGIGQSCMPNKFQRLLIPQLIIESVFLAEQFQVPLGTMMICILKEQESV